MGEVDFFGEVADKQRKFTFKSSFWETTLPQSFAQAMKAKHSKGFASSTEEGFPSSYSGTNVYTPIKAVGYIYRIKFFGNPGKLREPEIEIHGDGKRPSILTQKNYHMITRVYTDGQQGESDDYFADHCDGVTATINMANLDSGGSYKYNSYHYLGLSNSEIALLKACLGGSDDDDTNNIETYNWDWGNQIFPHLVKLVRSTTVYTDGGYYVALVWKSTDNHKERSTSNDHVGAFVLVNPFKSLDDDGTPSGTAHYGTDLYDIYTTKGTLALTTARTKSQTYKSQGYESKHHYGKTEAIFGFGSKEIIMTRPLHKDRTLDADSNKLGDLQVNAGDDSENTGSVSCEHLTNADNYYCLNKTDIFTLLAFDDGVTPAGEFGSSAPYDAKYNDVHFMANPPYLNLYSAEKLVSDRADYSVQDLFLTTVHGTPGTASGNDYSASTIAASTGLNKITTDISTNWAASLIGATNFEVGKVVDDSATGNDDTPDVEGCTVVVGPPVVLTCQNAADMTADFKPQVGDIVSSDNLGKKGVYITKVNAEFVHDDTDGEYELSDGPAADIDDAEDFTFYRHPQFQIYKFTPAPASTYKYVGECANRGTCDRAAGLCNCFAGYSSDACQTQNSLAV